MSDTSNEKFRQKLQKESQRWADENLLSPEQREAILLRYAPPPATESVKDFPLFIRAVLALAVILVGLAALLLISYNWDYLSGTAKLTIVGTVLAAAHVGGLSLRKTGWKHWADGAFFFAGIMFGVGIWQVGQVFHMSDDFPMFMWLWAFGAFLLALVLASTSLHILSVVLLTIWIFAETGESKMLFYGLVPAAAWSLPIFAALGISTASLKQNRFVVSLYSLLLVLWWVLLGTSCVHGMQSTFHVVAAGLIVLAVSAGMPKSTNSTILKYVGILLIFAGLIAPSYRECWESLLHRKFWDDHYSWTGTNPNVLLAWAFALPVIDFLVLFRLFRWRNRKERLNDLVRHNIRLCNAVTLWVILLFCNRSRYFFILS